MPKGVKAEPRLDEGGSFKITQKRASQVLRRRDVILRLAVEG